MSPDARFSGHVNELFHLLPQIREGSVDAVHDARVASRRLRATLELYRALHPDDDHREAQRTLRVLRRALGRVRDVDVALALSAQVEARAPVFAPALAVLRPRLVREALARRRKLIKRLERLSLRPLERVAQRRRAPAMTSRQLQAVLLSAIGARAQAVREAIERASGVYFPRRAHDARIELRSLRYLLELSGNGEPRRRALKLLRSSQEALGLIHDREVLLGWLREEKFPPDGATSAKALIGTLEAESRTMYEVYAASRPQILALCDAASRSTAAVREHTRSGLVALGAAVAAPAAFALFARVARRRAEFEHDRADLGERLRRQEGERQSRAHQESELIGSGPS